MPSGFVNVSEYHLGVTEGKSTWYFKNTENRLYKNGKATMEVKVEDDKAFFSKDGTVKTAMDPDWNKNLGSYNPATDPLAGPEVVQKS